MADELVTLPVRVKDSPHWRVVLRPGQYSRERIKTLSGCWETIESCRISKGGRTYPYVSRDPQYRQNGNDWIASWLDSWTGYSEYWRFFQSGQFVHLFSFWEDTEQHKKAGLPPKTLIGAPPSPSVTGYVDFMGAMMTITEIFEFAARLVQRVDFNDAVHLTVQMIGVRDRLLVSLDPTRLWYEWCPALEEVLGKEWLMSPADLLADAPAKALEAIFWFYERFQCRDLPMDLIRNEQRKFLMSK